MAFLFNRGRSRNNATVGLPKQARELLLRISHLQQLEEQQIQAETQPSPTPLPPQTSSSPLDSSEKPTSSSVETAQLCSQKLEELAKVLSQMKHMFQEEVEITPDQLYQLVMGIIEEDLLYLFALHLHRLPFESRKDTQVIYSYVFRFRPQNASPKSDPVALSYVINQRPQALIALCRAYDHKESATPAGTVLREVFRSEAAVAVILYHDEADEETSNNSLQQQQQQLLLQQHLQHLEAEAGAAAPTAVSPGNVNHMAPVLARVDRDKPQSGRGVFWRFFDWVDKSAFEVGADAFTTFRELLTRHKTLVPHYLAVNFDLFFYKYNTILVQSLSYVTKRQSIKLLGEILLDRSNYTVMTAYVDSGEHLKICMNLLRDERKMVQYEGFHVFKVFVANPNKSVAVQKILIMNRDKLLSFLAHFLEDRTDDEQFMDEREFLMKQIRLLPATPITPAQQPPSSRQQYQQQQQQQQSPQPPHPQQYHQPPHPTQPARGYV